MLRSSFGFALIFGLRLLTAQNVYYLPQVADGTVANGTLKTTISLANTARTAASISIAATQDDGSPRTLSLTGLGTGSRFNLKLAPGATRMLVTDGTGDGSAGAMVVTSDVPLSVSSILTFADPAGTTGSESALPAVTSQDLAAEYRLPVDTASGMNTGIALYDPAKAAATVTLRLLDETGAPQSDTVTVSVAAQGHTIRFIQGDLFGGVPDGFRGTLRVATSGAIRVAAAGIRRSGTSSAITLLPATNAIARRVRFLFPQVLDGPSANGNAILQTTFAITNLSATTPATPGVKFTQDDGTAATLNLQAPLGPIAPGGTAFVQTDGSSSALVSAAALVVSDQPVAVTAFVTAYDSSSATFLAETALLPAPLDYQFALPFENTTSSGGAVVWNAGKRAVAVNYWLVDPDGKPLSAPQTTTLAPGSRWRGSAGDLFPDVATAPPASGSIVVSAGSPVDASLAVSPVRQFTAPLSVSTTPAVRLPWNGDGTPPATVRPVLDGARKVTASIPSSGGSLTLRDAKGNQFTLTIPPGALLNRETITMTAIASVAGLSGAGLSAGVQLEPDGLGLIRPATLQIDLASAPPKGSLPIGWRGQAPGAYLNPALPDARTWKILLTHFSGAGVGSFDLTSELIRIANDYDLCVSAGSYLTAQAHEEAAAGDQASADIDFARALEVFELGYERVIEPMMELAMGGDDEDVMRCAAQLALTYSRTLILLGAPGDDPTLSAISDFTSYIVARYAQKLADRCNKHDFTAYFDLIAAYRQMELTGSDTAAMPSPSTCPPAVEFNFSSNIKGDVAVGVTGTFDALVTGKVTLSGNMTKEVLSQVIDPQKDLYTSFTLAGAAPATYNNINLQVNNLPAGCAVTVPRLTADNLTVKAGQDPKLSQVQFKFNPHYDPQAVTANGQQLCSFCPVYRKIPVKVELWVDPGKPAESIVMTCSGVSQTIPANFWWTGWSLNHAAAGDNGFIQGWDLVNTPDLLAQKNISQTVTNDGITLTEKTDLKLKPVSQ